MKNLRSSIYIWICTLFCLQLLLLYICSTIFTHSTLPPLRRWIIWIAITHALLLIFLFIRKRDFIVLSEGKALPPLKTVNMANVLTMFRLSSPPVLHYLLIASGVQQKALIGMLIFAVIISASDMFDGMLARKTQITRIGKYMDPMADYYIIAAISFALFSINLLSTWLLLLITTRLVVQGVLASIIIANKKIVLPSTILGKVMVCSIFVVYNFSLLKLFERLRETVNIIIPYMEVIVACLIIVSLCERVIIFIRSLHNYNTYSVHTQ